MNARNLGVPERRRSTGAAASSAAITPETLKASDIAAVLKNAPQQHTSRPHLTPPQKVTPSAPPRQPAEPSTGPTAVAVNSEQKLDEQTLAKQRATLGFDDIPVVSSEELQKEKDLRERMGVWASTAQKGERVSQFFKKEKYQTWKDDLKWAMDADKSDEPVTAKADITPREDTNRKPGSIQDVRPQVQETANKTIDINISFGSLPKPPKLPSFAPLLQRLNPTKWSRRTTATIGSGVVILLAVPGAIAIVNARNSATGIGDAAAMTNQKPSYQTIIPKGKTADQIVWQRVSPPDSNAVFAYTDTIGTVKIATTEQPIPDSFKTGVNEKVAELAKGYSATDKISAGSTTIYIGTSSLGPQSVVFTRNNLLILIKSETKIPDDSWLTYAQSLN